MWGAWSQVRPGERRDAAIAFASLFAFIAAHSLMETARDALFLARLPVSQLPWVYLAAAGAAWLATRISRRSTVTGGPGLASGVLLGAVLTALLGGLVQESQSWTLYAVYIWSALMATLVVGHFYVLLGERFTVTQAKRLYAFIGAGGVAGAIAGNAMASLLTAWLPARSLLSVAAGILALSALGPICLARTGNKDKRPADGSAAAEPSALSLRELWREPYARRLGVLMIVSTATLTGVDYVFKQAVVGYVPAGELATFFARFYLAVSVMSLVVQLVLVRPILRSVNIHGALLVLPLLLALGTFGIAAGGGILAALVLKGTDGALRHSLQATSMELLYVPMGARLRSAAKTTIDMVGQRAGQAAASLVILLAVALSAQPLHLCVAILLMSLLWLFLARGMRGDYLRLLRHTLEDSALSERAAFADLDLSSLESLIAALNSSDDGEVRASLQLLEERGRANLIPILILYHPSPDVVEVALDILIRSGREDFLPAAQRLANHEYAAVRAASLRAQIAIAPDEQILRDRLEVTCPVVRATAVVGLSAKGYATERETAESVHEIVEHGSEVAKEALAKAITYRPDPDFDDVLIRLAADPSTLVQQAAVHAMAAAPNEEFFAPLLAMLPFRRTREDVRQVLLSMGEPALAFIRQAFANPDTPAPIRRHLPRTIHRFEPATAADILMQQLPAESDGVVRYKILRALGRLQADGRAIQLDATILRTEAERTLKVAFTLIDWRISLERGALEQPTRRTDSHALLAQLVADKEQNAIERLFRILGLLYPKADLTTLYRGLRSPNPSARASSRELLEHVVPSAWRNAIVGLVDDAEDGVRLSSSGVFHKPENRAYEGLLGHLLQSGSVSLSALALHHVGELGLEGLDVEVDALKDQASMLFGEAAKTSCLAWAKPLPSGGA